MGTETRIRVTPDPARLRSLSVWRNHMAGIGQENGTQVFRGMRACGACGRKVRTSLSEA
jgi:hypothetical protein